MRKEIKCSTKCWFLRCCELKRVIPATLQYHNKDPQAHHSQYSQQEEDGWRLASEEAGMIVLVEALRRERARLPQLELRLRRMLRHSEVKAIND